MWFLLKRQPLINEVLMWVSNTDVDIAGFFSCSSLCKKRFFKINIGNGFINFDFWCNVALGAITYSSIILKSCIAPTKTLSRNLILADNS